MAESSTYPTIEKPTRVRYMVLGFLCALALVLYIDRVCIMQAVPAIKKELSLTNLQMSLVLAAFTLSYCLFEVPTGYWGDRYGSRGVLTRIVLWWSAFTALTGVATGLLSLLAVRFLFGAGEAGAFPNTARVLARWFPADSRGPAQGMINTFALAGGAMSPMLAQGLIDAVGWRWAFGVLALPGVTWAAVFYWWFRDDPASHPNANDAERQMIAQHAAHPGGIQHPPIPWGAVVRSANVWLLGGVIACSAFNTYLFFSWYPTYLHEGRGVNLQEASKLASMVLGAGAIGSTVGGALIDWLIHRTGNRRASRRGLGFASLALGAIMLLTGSLADSAGVSALWMAAGSFAMHMTLASWWGAVADVSGPHLGALFGLMNSVGGIGAIASQLFLGSFTDWMALLGYVGRAQWDPAFFIYTGILGLGAFGWLFIDTTRPIESIVNTSN
jgi:MFS family permease